jgi:hypothetical protein
MSKELLSFVSNYVESKEDPERFVDLYIRSWSEERDNGLLAADSPEISEALSTIFCLADMYNPDQDRAEYELDDNGLRAAVMNVLQKIRL